MTDKIPENSAQNSPPDSLQETSFTCGECGEGFETAQALADHTIDCDEGE